MRVQKVGGLGRSQRYAGISNASAASKTLATIATKISEKASRIDSVVQNISRTVSALDTAIGNGKRIMQVLKQMQNKTVEAVAEQSQSKLRDLDQEYQKNKESISSLVQKSTVGDVNLLRSGIVKLTLRENQTIDIPSHGVTIKELGLDQDSLINRNKIVLARRNIQTKAMPKLRNALLNLGKAEKGIQVKKSFAQTKIRSLCRGIKFQDGLSATRGALKVQKEIAKVSMPLSTSVSEFLSF